MKRILQQKEMACRRKWRLTDTDLCLCGETQAMSYIVQSCPLTKLNGSLSRLHSADEDAVSWLTSYGSWHTYEKKKLSLSFLSPWCHSCSCIKFAYEIIYYSCCHCSMIWSTHSFIQCCVTNRTLTKQTFSNLKVGLFYFLLIYYWICTQSTWNTKQKKTVNVNVSVSVNHQFI